MAIRAIDRYNNPCIRLMIRFAFSFLWVSLNFTRIDSSISRNILLIIEYIFFSMTIIVKELRAMARTIIDEMISEILSILAWFFERVSLY